MSNYQLKRLRVFWKKRTFDQKFTIPFVILHEFLHWIFLVTIARNIVTFKPHVWIDSVGFTFNEIYLPLEKSDIWKMGLTLMSPFIGLIGLTIGLIIYLCLGKWNEVTLMIGLYYLIGTRYLIPSKVDFQTLKWFKEEFKNQEIIID